MSAIDATRQAAAPERAAAPVTRGPRRRVLVPVAFGVLLTLLVVRNRALFSVVVHEGGDPAANSILVVQAKHFDLLVGNYSRLGFNHPGPAFFYVEALGEWLFHDLLGVVPTPWNGQLLAVLAVNAALLAATLWVLAGWARSATAVALAAAAGLGFVAGYGELVTSGWTPNLAFAPFLLLLAAGASVAAGRPADLWALALAGGLLVHGHAQFLFFVPLIVAAVLAVRWYRGVRGRHAKRANQQRRDWLPALAVAGVFALPLVLNLVLRWPGDFARYFGYGSSSRAGGHPPLEALGYVLRFWPGGVVGLAAGVVLAVVAVRLSRSPFVVAGVALAGVVTVLLFGYALVGIDDLGEAYVGYFYRAVPLLVAALAAVAVGDRLPDRAPVRGVAAAVLAAALVAMFLTPTLIARREHVPGVPQAIEAMTRRAAGRPMVLDLQHGAWPEMVGVVIAGHRRGERICVRDRSWRVMVTADFMCTVRERDTGVPFRLSLAGQTPPDAAVLATLGRVELSAPR